MPPIEIAQCRSSKVRGKRRGLRADPAVPCSSQAGAMDDIAGAPMSSNGHVPSWRPRTWVASLLTASSR